MANATSVTRNRLSTFQSTAAPRTTTAVHPSCHICGLIRSNSARNVNAQRSPHHAAGRMLRARHTSSGIYHRRSTPSITATRGCSLFEVTSLGTGISSARTGEGGRLAEVEEGAVGDVIEEDDTAAGRRERLDVASPGAPGSKGGLKGVFRLRRPGMKALRLRVRGGWRGGKEGILRVDASLNSRHGSRYSSCLERRFTDKRRSKVELDQAEGVEVVSTAVQLEIDSLWFWAVAEIIRCPTFV
ncbi:hypothetical protein H109_06880 [Trichophyton interdigitale MR816]|uniref:Uncharacterized protein n=1 Tax=Trichophyton interdigitale (strain MR816) TaxID=1215338 RepID=A0A059J036_TRIIM|nr:hypothetical protein H101_00582 [Trichophyton interdigitale H6]KDB21216.1 hypothetical protein H109_06880 [Trichophyton interdigitale MR816]